MFKTKSCTSQRGAALLESLIGMLVLSIATMGTLLTLAHGIRAQRVDSARAQVIGQVRSQLLNQGVALCGTALPLRIDAQEVSADVACDAIGSVDVAFPGASTVTIDVPVESAQLLTVTIESPRLGGALTVASTH